MVDLSNKPDFKALYGVHTSVNGNCCWRFSLLLHGPLENSLTIISTGESVSRIWQWKIPIFNWKNTRIRWWFQIFLEFSPRKLGKTSNLTSIFFRWVEATNRCIFKRSVFQPAILPVRISDTASTPNWFHVGNPTKFPKAIPARYEEWFNFLTS